MGLGVMLEAPRSGSILALHVIKGHIMPSILHEFDSLKATACCPVGFAWPSQGQPIAFLDCASEEQRTALPSSSSTGTSYQNKEEASVVVKVVQQLLSGAEAIQTKDIGIITPYSGQVLICCLLSDEHLYCLYSPDYGLLTVHAYNTIS